MMKLETLFKDAGILPQNFPSKNGELIVETEPLFKVVREESELRGLPKRDLLRGLAYGLRKTERRATPEHVFYAKEDQDHILSSPGNVIIPWAILTGMTGRTPLLPTFPIKRIRISRIGKILGELGRLSFKEVTFIKCDFRGDLENMDWHSCQFIQMKAGAPQHDTGSQPVRIRGKIQNCTFTKCDMRRADLSQSTIVGVTISDSDFRGAALGECRNVKFKNTKLHNVTWGNVEGVELEGCRISKKEKVALKK